MPLDDRRRQQQRATARRGFDQKRARRFWQPDRGHYLVHAHVGDRADSFDESQIIPISTVLALYAGMAVPEQVGPILEATARAEAIAGTDRAGTTLSMPFPDHFFESIAMPGRQYQNGAVWDWWGGLQIVSEFEHGESERAIGHLDAAARYWEFAGEIYEWFHLPSRSGQGSPQFAGAAATMAQGVIRGLFGVDMAIDGLPRLHPGSVRATAPCVHRGRRAARSRLRRPPMPVPSRWSFVQIQAPMAWPRFDCRQVGKRLPYF